MSGPRPASIGPRRPRLGGARASAASLLRRMARPRPIRPQKGSWRSRESS